MMEDIAKQLLGISYQVVIYQVLGSQVFILLSLGVGSKTQIATENNLGLAKSKS